MAKTKKSLIASGLAIVVCLAMLVGTTFAWFTDSATNKGNRIEAGTLDIDLLMDKGQNGQYTSIANGTGDIFSENAGNGVLWEPGRTEIVYLAVQNKGSLALNYNILLDVMDGDPGLIGSLEYAVLDGKKAADLEAVKDWDGIKAVAGVHTGDIVAGRTVAAPNGTLDEIVNGTKDETQYFALAVHMKESAGNAYQNGSITIDVNVIAKQATAETDGFGSSDYDAGAVWPVSSTEEMTSALAQAQDGDTIALTGDIELESDLVVNKNITFDGRGVAVISGRPVRIGTTNEVTFKNITFTDPQNGNGNASAIYATGSFSGKLVIDGCTFTDIDYEALQIVPVANAEIIITNNHFSDCNKRYVHIQNTVTNSPIYVKIKLNGNTFDMRALADDDPSNDRAAADAVDINGIYYTEETDYSGNFFPGCDDLSPNDNFIYCCWVADGDAYPNNVIDETKLLDPQIVLR